MSKIDISSLRNTAQSGAENRDEYMRKKKIRIEECVKVFNQKISDLHLLYFDDNNKFSINKSLERACKKAYNPDYVELYMNFNISDFSGWGKFVPFQPDQYGKNLNARPANCLRMYLTRAQADGYLPSNIKFDVWGNKSFTVKFTIDFKDEEFESNKPNAHDDAEKVRCAHSEAGDSMVTIVSKDDESGAD
mgnify:CR=1 FL=1|tara:strand:+ start:418 stop:990 length:573 start_codon:yes stop_codon:yes gene_type:complete